MKINDSMKKNIKLFSKDLELNTLAFAIYIVAQHILLLPLLAKQVGDEQFFFIVLFTSIFSIITNSLGSELGIARQIKSNSDINDGISGDTYNRMLIYIIPLIAFISFILFIIFDFSLFDSFIYTIITVLGNIRLYLLGYFRLKKDFKRVVLQNIFYVIGLLLGLIGFLITKIMVLPFILSEIVSIIYSINKTDFLNTSQISLSNIKNDFLKIGNRFFDLSSISFLTNLMNYFDKLIIYPILGSNAVSIYYAANSMSKAINLIVNPIYGVVLSWLGSTNDNKKNLLINTSIKLSLIVGIITGIISYPISLFALKILYSQYFNSAQNLLVIICVGIGFSVSISMIKGLLLRFCDSRTLLKNYLLYFVFFIGFSLPLSSNYGIVGFVYAVLFAKIEQWLAFIILLIKVRNK